MYSVHKLLPLPLTAQPEKNYASMVKELSRKAQNRESHERCMFVSLAEVGRFCTLWIRFLITVASFSSPQLFDPPMRTAEAAVDQEGGAHED